LVIGHVMVADDKIDPFALGVSYFFYRFDATVESDEQRDAVFGGIVDTFVGNTVSLFITVGDIVVESRIIVL